MRAKVIAAAAVAAFLSGLWVGPATAQYTGGRPPGVEQPGGGIGPGGQVGPGGQFGPGGQRPSARLTGTQLTPVNVLTRGVQLSSPQVRVVRVLRAGDTSAVTRRGIAFTGADIAQLLLIGGALVAVGTVLTRTARRRPAAGAVTLR